MFLASVDDASLLVINPYGRILQNVQHFVPIRNGKVGLHQSGQTVPVHTLGSRDDQRIGKRYARTNIDQHALRAPAAQAQVSLVHPVRRGIAFYRKYDKLPSGIGRISLQSSDKVVESPAVIAQRQVQHGIAMTEIDPYRICGRAGLYVPAVKKNQV